MRARRRPARSARDRPGKRRPRRLRFSSVGGVDDVDALEILGELAHELFEARAAGARAVLDRRAKPGDLVEAVAATHAFQAVADTACGLEVAARDRVPELPELEAAVVEEARDQVPELARYQYAVAYGFHSARLYGARPARARNYARSRPHAGLPRGRVAGARRPRRPARIAQDRPQRGTQ